MAGLRHLKLACHPSPLPCVDTLNAGPHRARAPGPRRKLQDALAPVSLKVTNDSHKHAGHAGNPGGEPDAETHFRIEVQAGAPFTCHNLNLLAPAYQRK